MKHHEISRKSSWLYHDCLLLSQASLAWMDYQWDENIWELILRPQGGLKECHSNKENFDPNRIRWKPTAATVLRVERKLNSSWLLTKNWISLHVKSLGSCNTWLTPRFVQWVNLRESPPPSRAPPPKIKISGGDCGVSWHEMLGQWLLELELWWKSMKITCLASNTTKDCVKFPWNLVLWMTCPWPVKYLPKTPRPQETKLKHAFSRKNSGEGPWQVSSIEDYQGNSSNASRIVLANPQRRTAYMKKMLPTANSLHGAHICWNRYILGETCWLTGKKKASQWMIKIPNITCVYMCAKYLDVTTCAYSEKT